ncbi:MAG TPA: polysaccharide biosynthesis tyrosine autokinase, partial [Longimicrobiaceae bacterium]|nr:polysaccharide biosynthesis tyrosine autokinase [Longimicrobiaceae bacterium]
VPNAAMASFIRYESGAAHTETSSMVGFLRQQVASYDTQLREAEAQVRAYREQQRVVSPKDEATEEVHRLAELQAQRDEVLSQRNALSSLLDQAAQHSAEGTSRYRQLASFPQFLTNRAVQDILQSITTLENQRSELSVRRSGENLDVQRFDRRISELEMELFRIAQSYRQSLDTQLASLNANLAQFGARLGGIPAREIEFARLARQQKLLEEIATLLQTRLKEAEIQEAVVPGDIRIIDPALVPRRPVAPRPVLNMALGLIFGMLLGTGAAFLREALDRKIRDREQVDVLTGGVPVLGTIPRFTPVAALPASSGSGRALAAPQDVLGASLVTQREPRGPVAEAYRALRTSLTFARRMGKQQVIVVTSAMPGDGKSTSASNLAITLAQQGTRTLLVDADLRKGLLHGIFGLRQDPGLAHVLLGRSSVEDVLQSVPVEGSDTPLHFLASGVFPPNPAELLGSDAVEELMRELRSAYDVIIIDAPPLNLVTDAALLSRVADATVLVVRVGVTERAALQHAIAQLRQLQTPLSGVVLNDVDVRAGHYYGYYGVDT